MLASFFAPIGPASVLDVARRTSGWLWWGFCSIRSWLAEYLRRVAALMMQFPPRLVAAEPRVEGVWPPICRPIG